MNKEPYTWINSNHKENRLGLLYQGDVVLEGANGGPIYGDIKHGNRIVSILNACRHIKDPEKSIPEMMEALKKLADDHEFGETGTVRKEHLKEARRVLSLVEAASGTWSS